MLTSEPGDSNTSLHQTILYYSIYRWLEVTWTSEAFHVVYYTTIRCGRMQGSEHSSSTTYVTRGRRFAALVFLLVTYGCHNELPRSRRASQSHLLMHIQQVLDLFQSFCADEKCKCGPRNLRDQALHHCRSILSSLANFPPWRICQNDICRSQHCLW